jgi:hypothetical protein
VGNDKLMETDKKLFVAFEVLSVVHKKSSIFWDLTLCTPLRVNLRFGGISHLYLQGQRIIINQREAGSTAMGLFKFRIIQQTGGK